MRVIEKVKVVLSVIGLSAALLCGTVNAEDSKYTRDTMMEVILFTPALREAMAKHVPDLMANPQIDQASVISLGDLAGYVPDQLTDDVINAILADLNKVEVK